MTWIWTAFMLISLLCALISGRTAPLSAAVLEGASHGISLAISLAGPLCLWSGLNHLMAQIGLMRQLSRWLAPVLGRLFPQAWQNPAAKEALSANVSANLLGLGSAATPPGLQAVRQMARSCGGTATNELCRFVVLNTASVQLFPATVASLRAAAGAAAPFDILPAVWFTSLCSVTLGLLAAKGLELWH